MPKTRQVSRKTSEKPPILEPWRLKQMQSLSPEAKVQRTIRKIREFVDGVDGMAYISWSGGLDSRVMLSIARDECGLSPERVPAVFIDTGLEYPEVKECALRHSQVVLNPKMSFAEVVKKYGYPVVSKKVCKAIRKLTTQNLSPAYRESLLHGNDKGSMESLPAKWHFLLNAPFKCSDWCCEILKKQPSRKYERETKRFKMVGMRAEDGHTREKSFLFNRGGSCNVFGDKPSSWPLAIWLDSDIWWYVKSRNLDYPVLYDRGATGTGCFACMFGVHMEKPENRFQRMFRDHPKLWKACMDGFGCRQVMEYIGLQTEPETPEGDLWSE